MNQRAIGGGQICGESSLSLTYRCGGINKGPRHQRTFKKEIDTSKIKCHCGANLHIFTRDKNRDKERTCRCSGIPYNHRIGSKSTIQGGVVYCDDYKGDMLHEKLLEMIGANRIICDSKEPPF